MKLASYEKCCGCGNCQVVCSQKAIVVRYDKIGFLHPVIDSDKCINCKLCEKKCPVINNLAENRKLFEKKGYYGRSNNGNLVKKCSSGGVASEISYYFMKNGASAVYGSAYAEDFKKVFTKRIDKSEDLWKLCGSKYVQSVKGEAFLKIRQDLVKGKKVLYIGLPCEIAALNLFLENKNSENLYCIDLICHGPTSSIVLEDYLKKISNSDRNQIVKFNMRYKKDGEWVPYYIHTELSNGMVVEEPFWKSHFGLLFSRFCCNACHFCKMKGEYKFSDLTIGDAWGISEDLKKDYSTGLCSIIVNTEKGEKLLKSSNIELMETSIDEIIKGNPNIISTREKSLDYEMIYQTLPEKGLEVTAKKIKSYKNRMKNCIRNHMKRMK